MPNVSEDLSLYKLGKQIQFNEVAPYSITLEKSSWSDKQQTKDVVAYFNQFYGLDFDSGDINAVISCKDADKIGAISKAKITVKCLTDNYPTNIKLQFTCVNEPTEDLNLQLYVNGYVAEGSGKFNIYCNFPYDMEDGGAFDTPIYIENNQVKTITQIQFSYTSGNTTTYSLMDNSHIITTGSVSTENGYLKTKGTTINDSIFTTENDMLKMGQTETVRLKTPMIYDTNDMPLFPGAYEATATTNEKLENDLIVQFKTQIIEIEGDSTPPPYIFNFNNNYHSITFKPIDYIGMVDIVGHSTHSTNANCVFGIGCSHTLGAYNNQGQHLIFEKINFTTSGSLFYIDCRSLTTNPSNPQGIILEFNDCIFSGDNDSHFFQLYRPGDAKTNLTIKLNNCVIQNGLSLINDYYGNNSEIDYAIYYYIHNCYISELSTETIGDSGQKHYYTRGLVNNNYIGNVDTFSWPADTHLKHWGNTDVSK